MGDFGHRRSYRGQLPPRFLRTASGTAGEPTTPSGRGPDHCLQTHGAVPLTRSPRAPRARPVVRAPAAIHDHLPPGWLLLPPDHTPCGDRHQGTGCSTALQTFLRRRDPGCTQLQSCVKAHRRAPLASPATHQKSWVLIQKAAAAVLNHMRSVWSPGLRRRDAAGSTGCAGQGAGLPPPLERSSFCLRPDHTLRPPAGAAARPHRYDDMTGRC